MQLECFDIHCHILPGVDDGAKDMAMTEQMLRIAASEGINRILFTPHYREGMFETDSSVIKSRFEEVRILAEEKFPDLSLFLGSEIYYHSEIINSIKKGRAWTLANSSYILAEFSYGRDYPYIRRAAEHLRLEGYRMILAHFERYDCLRDRLDRLQELVKEGSYLQITADHVVKMHKKIFPNYIKKAFEEDLVHLVGTDAHNDTHRPPMMRECVACLLKKYGEDVTNRLIFTNPMKILKDEYI